MSETRLKIAVFIDFDNIEIGVKTTLGGHFDVGAVLEAIKERGEVVTKIAYGDWTRAGDYSRSLTQHAIHMVQRNLTPGGDKNGADINLALDALEMAFTHNHINAFVIVGGDSDFMALVEKLKQYDRKVFVVGGRAFTSVILQKNCTEFIAYENLVGAAPRKTGRAGGRPGEAPAANAVPLIRRALKVLADREVSPQLGVLKSTLLQLDSTFSEREYGASTFRDFVQRLARAGYLTLKGTDRNIYVELRDGDGAASGATSGAAPAGAPGATSPGTSGGAREGEPLAADAGDVPPAVEGEVVGTAPAPGLAASEAAESGGAAAAASVGGGRGAGPYGGADVSAGAEAEDAGINGAPAAASVLSGDAGAEASGPELAEGESAAGMSPAAGTGGPGATQGGRRGDGRFDRERDHDRGRDARDDRGRDARDSSGGAASGSPPEALRFITGVFKRPGIVSRWPLYLRQVKQILRSVDETFDERRYGFTGIVEALRYCQREGLFRLDRDRQGVLRVYPGLALQRAASQVSGARESDADTAPVAAAADRDERGGGERAEPAAAETLDLFPMSEGSADAPSRTDEEASAEAEADRDAATVSARAVDAETSTEAIEPAPEGEPSTEATSADAGEKRSRRKRGGTRRGGKTSARKAGQVAGTTKDTNAAAAAKQANAGGAARKTAANAARPRAAKSARPRKNAKPPAGA